MEMYKDLCRFLEQTDVKDKFEMTFIDLEEENMEDFENAKKVIERGLKLPITLINGKPAFSGKVDQIKTYQIVKRM
ncbi:hypothetical protein [Alkaliphilus hydrothermalis]|uniref:Glutaredoxin n=1 Tax=Alkaliphilus hydrothermalis TaxID=1482730 RepID=A0ABS2NQC1_9FIRM|nr:hypothetical protein [Alkaliphilus hydrothermalis]MBM7615087.1 glutaredoxin [Alkaliphilus hydrothermalis]